MSALCVPAPRRPDVSVVIVTHNAGEVLGQALGALLENTEPCYELIVVDNGSDDDTPSVLEQIENATIILNARNYGFGVGNNQAAARARGSYLAFLNQDAFVHAGWLPPLVERIESDERVGAVGPMLLNLDGSLQCAGALLSRSGSVACYGEGDRPDRPEYGFTRVVDFLAGALSARPAPGLQRRRRLRPGLRARVLRGCRSLPCARSTRVQVGVRTVFAGHTSPWETGCGGLAAGPTEPRALRASLAPRPRLASACSTGRQPSAHERRAGRAGPRGIRR